MSAHYIVEQRADNWRRASRLINFLLRENAEIRWTTESFSARTSSRKPLQLERGAFLITKARTTSPLNFDAALERYAVTATAVTDLQGFVGLLLNPLRIAIYGGGGAPFNHARIFAELGFQAEFISPQDIRAGKLDDYDLFAVPGGGGLAMVGQLNPLGEEGCRLIKAWVQRGGMYIGSCAGAFDAAIVSESFLEVCPQQRHLQLVNALIWNRDDTEWIGLESPDVGVIESRNLKPEHPIMFGLPERFDITHYNGPLFDVDTDLLPDASVATGLSAVVGSREAFTHSEQFLRPSQSGETEATVLGKASLEGRFNIVSGYNGLGRVVLFGSHPEFGYNLAMDEWGLPARMLANAAFWQAGQLREARPPCVKRESGVAHAWPSGGGLNKIADDCGAISDAVEQLRDLAQADSAWLAEDHAMSVFGMSGRMVWERGLKDFADLTGRIHDALERATTLVERAEALLSADSLKNDGPKQLLREMVRAFKDALHYQTPAEWQQDFGYEGVLQLLARTEAMLRRAIENSDTAFEASANPYAYFESSPYQLVVGSYLAANGVYLNCWQLLQAHLLRIEEQIFAVDCASAD